MVKTWYHPIWITRKGTCVFSSRSTSRVSLCVNFGVSTSLLLSLPFLVFMNFFFVTSYFCCYYSPFINNFPNRWSAMVVKIRLAVGHATMPKKSKPSKCILPPRFTNSNYRVGNVIRTLFEDRIDKDLGTCSSRFFSIVMISNFITNSLTSHRGSLFVVHDTKTLLFAYCTCTILYSGTMIGHGEYEQIRKNVVLPIYRVSNVKRDKSNAICWPMMAYQ